MGTLDDYLVFIISCYKDWEKKWLNLLGIKDVSEWIVRFIDIDGRQTRIEDKNLSLIFLNQNHWKSNFEGIKRGIDALNKKLIIHTHIGDVGNEGVSMEEIAPVFSNEVCNPFHHRDEIVCEFLDEIIKDYCPEKYKEELEKLIERSLSKKKKSNLIALNILCQGYLAAHEIDSWYDNLPSELKENVIDKAKDTENIDDWWLPVFANTPLNIKDELSQLNNPSINDLWDAIEQKKLSGNDAVQKVQKACIELSLLLARN